MASKTYELNCSMSDGSTKSAGTFVVEDGARGTGVLKVTTTPTSYTTATGGINPIKRMSISTIKTQAGVDEVLVGDLIAHSYYHYHIYYLDATYAYMDTVQNIRGATGAKGEQGIQGEKGETGEAGAAGANGEDGADGKSAYSYAQDGGFEGTEAQFTQTLANAVDKTKLAIGLHTDGLLYVFVDGAPVGYGIALPSGGTGGDVVGNVDSANTIILNGDLADGTYTVKYEMADGSTIDIGNLVLDTAVYYTITSNLTNCSINNNAAQIAAGDSYSATITANEGYALESVNVTMGGSAVTVTDGVISIASVTGDIIITATAAEDKPLFTNLAEPNTDNTTDWSIWINDARIGSDGGYRSASNTGNGRPMVSNYIPIKTGDVVRCYGMYTAPQASGLYNSSKGAVSTSVLSSMPSTRITDLTQQQRAVKFTVVCTESAYVRIGGCESTDAGGAMGCIITVNEEIIVDGEVVI